MKKLNFTFIFTLFGVLFLSAQSIAPCGTVITQQDMQAYYQRSKPQLLKSSNAVVHIPITYHLVADNNGNGAFSLGETFDLHCSLVEDYAPAQVKFYIHDIVYHNSTYYYYMQGTSAGNDMFNNENVDNTCNIYIVETAKSGSNPVCGYSYLASYGNIHNKNGIMLDKGCVGAGSTTLTHEMGHYLNLPHTFSGWEGRDYFNNPIPNYLWERVDGNNCSNSGDGFCDTPPDYTSDRWNCNTAVQYTDASGQTFSPDEKNYMSYSSDYCQEYLSSEQQAEVNAAPAAYRPYLLTLPTPSLAPVGTPTILYPKLSDGNLSYDSINFAWTASPNAEGYLVQFTQTNFNYIEFEHRVDTNFLNVTNIAANRNYKWRVKAFSYGNVCSEYTPEERFKTSSFSIDPLVQNVTCFNFQNGKITVNASQNLSNFKLYKYNFAQNNQSLVASINTNIFNGLEHGTYKVCGSIASSSQSCSFISISSPDELEIGLSETQNSILANVNGGTPPYAFSWSNGQSTLNNTNPTVGSNTLAITDANGCFQQKSINFIGNASSIYDVNNSSWKIYSNPIQNNFLQIEFDQNEYDEVNIDIVNVAGQSLASLNRNISNTSSLVTMDVSSFAKGIYYVRVFSNGDYSYKKLIIQ